MCVVLRKSKCFSHFQRGPLAEVRARVAPRADEIELTEYDNGEEEEPDEVEDFPSHGNAGDVWLPQGY